MPDATAVVYDQHDASLLARVRPVDVATVLPLTPIAAHIIRDAGLPTEDPLSRHGTKEHASDARLRVGVIEEAERRLRKYRLSETSKQALCDHLGNLACISSRLWATLGRRGPWMVFEGRTPRMTDRKEHAHRIVLERILSRYSFSDCIAEIGKTPRSVYKQLFRENIKLLRRVALTKPVFFNHFCRGFQHLCNEIESRHAGLYQVMFSPVAATEYQLRYLETWHQWAAENPPEGVPYQLTITVPPTRMPLHAWRTRRFLRKIRDPLLLPALDCVRDSLVKTVEVIESLLLKYRSYLRAANARAVISWDHANWYTMAPAEAARDLGIRSILVCHTSVSPGRDDITLAGKGRRTRQLTAGNLADEVWVQSPSAEQAVAQIRPDVKKSRVEPFVWGWEANRLESHQEHSDEFVILHAGNYFDWASYLPWAYETSFDFAEHVTALIGAVRRLPHTRLIVRMKSNFAAKGELDEESLCDTERTESRVEFRHDGSFVEDLRQADLVVSFHSTTVEEALLCRKPVLLLGGRQRYRHVAARSVPPTPDSRAAVYQPYDYNNLDKFLEAIRKAHAGRPLSDEEVKGYVWLPGDAYSLSEITNVLVGKTVRMSA